MMKPHIVLIHGAWHNEQAFDKIMPLLKNEGYQVTAPSLPSVGAELPITSIDPDVSLIRDVLTKLLDDGKEVVVCMHSYGGIPGSSALKGLSRKERQDRGLEGGVVALVYICAWMITERRTLQSVASEKKTSMIMELKDNKLFHMNPIESFYNDMNSKEAQKYAAILSHQSPLAFTSPLTYPAYLYIPTTYLACTEDAAIPYEQQLEMVENVSVRPTLFTCNAGHSPFLSQPDLTVRVIRHAAGEDITVINKV